MKETFSHPVKARLDLDMLLATFHLISIRKMLYIRNCEEIALYLSVICQGCAEFCTNAGDESEDLQLWKLHSLYTA